MTNSPLWQYLVEQKYRVLLLLLVGSLLSQPFVRGSAVGRIIHEGLVAISILALMVVFELPWQRWIVIVLAVPALAARWAGETVSVAIHPTYGAAVAVAAVVFIVFAIVAILRNLFSKRTVSGDHLIGVFCGYLLAGIAWSNLYVVVEDLSPGSFKVEPGLTWQVDDPDARRSLFNYFSFTTLTTVGFGDVTPTSPVACSLAWLEAAFGQFYVAVLVAQLVGLKLAEPR